MNKLKILRNNTENSFISYSSSPVYVDTIQHPMWGKRKGGGVYVTDVKLLVEVIFEGCKAFSPVLILYDGFR